MGCDIHLYVEKRNADGTWETLKGPNPWIKTYEDSARTWRERAKANDISKFTIQECLDRALDAEQRADKYRNATLATHIADSHAWHDEHGYEHESDEELTRQFNEYDGPEVYKDWIWDGRNYDLFAILADVRNGRGFAGVYTGTGFNPISDPRGLPTDVSEYVKTQSDRWDSDGHSHSYHTVKQLAEFNWNQKTIHAGENSPESYATCAGNFYTESIPKLKEIAGDDLESVRIVFLFDN